jgi:hypothetical protein
MIQIKKTIVTMIKNPNWLEFVPFLKNLTNITIHIINKTTNEMTAGKKLDILFQIVTANQIKAMKAIIKITHEIHVKVLLLAAGLNCSAIVSLAVSKYGFLGLTGILDADNLLGDLIPGYMGRGG